MAATPSKKKQPSRAKGRADSNPKTPKSPDKRAKDTSMLDEQANQAYEEALDDVHTRFILNLPAEELASSDRIFFQLEQAYWFYDDFLCDDSELVEGGTPLPRFKNLKPFCSKMFEISPILSPLRSSFDEMWNEFAKYKRKISTYGTVLLNEECTHVILCKAWGGEAWTFPAGKVNQNEKSVEAAGRETYEETGFDPNCQLGATKLLKAQAESGEGPKLSWVTPLEDINELHYIEEGSKKRRACYVCRGVPKDFDFDPVARKEVAEVAWHDLNDLPKKNFAVLPFVTQLRRWIKKQKKKGNNRTNSRGRDSSTVKKRQGGNRTGSRGKVRDENDSLAASGLANVGDDTRWTEEDMFKTNEKMSGHIITYDGNPHEFTDKGFDGKDPHAFHIVGGAFLNSGKSDLAPAPDESKLQKLFRAEGADAVTNILKSSDPTKPNDERKAVLEKSAEQRFSELTPFFSDDGATPWGEVVSDALTEQTTTPADPKKKKKGQKKASSTAPSSSGTAMGSNAPGLALLNMIQKGSATSTQTSADVADKECSALDTLFMTDAEITAKSQKEKLTSQHNSVATESQAVRSKQTDSLSTVDHHKFVQQWLDGLPKAPATDRFGDFRFDVDAIMAAMAAAV